MIRLIGHAGGMSAAQLAQAKRIELETRLNAATGRKPPPPPPPKPESLQSNKRPLLSRVLLAGDVILTSIESSATTVIGSASTSASASITHKYGQEAGQASAQLGGSVVNVSLAVVNARGVGRKALIKGAGKGIVKTRMKNESGKTYGVQKEGELIEKLNDGTDDQTGTGSGKNTPPSYFSSSPKGNSSPDGFNEKQLQAQSFSSSTPRYSAPSPPPGSLPPALIPSRSSSGSPQPSFHSAHSSFPTASPSVSATRTAPKKQASTGWTRPPPPSADEFDAIVPAAGQTGGNNLAKEMKALNVSAASGVDTGDQLGAGMAQQATLTRRRMPPPL